MLFGGTFFAISTTYNCSRLCSFSGYYALIFSIKKEPQKSSIPLWLLFSFSS
jgi:hypothetical protein